MKEALIFVVGCSLLSMTLGVIERHRDVNKLRKLAKITRQFIPQKKLSIRDWLGILIALTDIALILLIDFTGSKLSNHKHVAINLYIVTTISTLVLISMRYNLFSKDNILGSLLKKVIGVSAVIITLLSSIYADHEISRLTNSDPSFFPNAQKAITLIISPFTWLLFSFYLNLLVYFVLGVRLICIQIMSFNYISNIINSIRILMNIKKTRRKKSISEAKFEDFCLLAGLAVSIIFMPMITKLTISTYNLDNAINKILIFSSYQDNALSCDNVLDKSAKIAYLRNDTISIATSNNGEYIFNISKCIRSNNATSPTKTNTSS